MVRDAVRTGLEAGLLIALLGLIVWATGQPFVFPSLGPTAFALALRNSERTTARRVLGGHLWGVAFGLLVYHTLAEGLVITGEHIPFSTDDLFLSASAALSVTLTSAAMLLTRTSHAPACATTLIVALGLLPTVVDGAIIMGAVTLLFLAHSAYLYVEQRMLRTDRSP